MDKNHILAEIERTAQDNGGIPLGKRRFYAETGIKETDWFGKYWARWGDALKEAGYTPNEFQGAYDDAFLLEMLITLIRELGRYPVIGELRIKAREEGFPGHNTFTRLGRKAELASKIVEYCRQRQGYEDVLEICEPLCNEAKETRKTVTRDVEEFGYVYLLKSGRYYKIGRSNAVGRRERELAIQLPEKANVIHAIKTDDPAGIETYWHNRFVDKRKNGEWFELTQPDIQAFKRLKFM